MDGAMNLCFIIHNLTASAGSERAQTNLANALSRAGDTITIWSCYGKGRTPGFELSGQTTVVYGARRAFPGFLDYPWLMCKFAWFVFYYRPEWIICTDTNRLIVALIAAFVPGVRLAVWEHFAIAHSITKARGRLARQLAAVLAKRIVTLTTRDAKMYAELYSPRGNVLTIPNIVLRPDLRGADRRNEVLGVGRLVPQKGFDLLLDAWSIARVDVPGWQLRIIGDGDHREALQEQAHKLGIEHDVLFTPHCKDPFYFYQECGLFVLSSRFEGLPYALIEAMTCGAACISFDCPNGPSELIKNGMNGVLVEAEQVSALAEAIVRLVRNPELRREIGDRARDISTSFSEAHVTARWREALSVQV